MTYIKTCYSVVNGWLNLIAICFLFGCNTTDNGALPNSKTDELKPYDLSQISLPPGFSIGIYAKVPGARSMTLSPSGTLFVGTMGNNVYAVRDDNQDGKADKIYIVAKGLNTPNGVAFKNGSLFIATISTIYRLDSIENNLSAPPAPVIVYDKYPSDKHHGWKFIAFGPDGKLYIPVGAPCNVCDNANPVYASITRMNADGTGMEIFAKGIRNTVGFDWEPGTNQLWFTENGRDNMGDDMPNDELNTAPHSGMHFGFPYCHQGNTLDPEFGKDKNCSDYTPPELFLGPHVAALGMRFYTGDMFPKEYKHAIFIAEHGSWNRSTPIGYRVSVAMRDSGNKLIRYAQFAEGWLHPDGSSKGRPVVVQQLADGSLLVSDDYNGLIYRVTYKK